MTPNSNCAGLERILLEHRRWITEALHGVLAAAALAAAFLLRFEFTLDPSNTKMLLSALPLLLGVKLAVFRAFGLRHLAWRYMGFPELVRMAMANLAGTAAATIALRLAIGRSFPRSIHIIDLLLCLTLMVAAHTVVRLLFEPRGDAAASSGARQRIVIYGAGKAGVTLLREIVANPQIGYDVAAFLDDDPQKSNLRIHGVRVLGGRQELTEIVRRHHVAEVLMALPTATGNQVTAILEQCLAARVTARKIPALAELIDRRVLVDQIRDVRIEDLLGRKPVFLEESAIRERLAGRIVLVTGAGGSIGSELCRQIARYGTRALVGFDQAETALYQIDQEMRECFPDCAFYPEVGSVQNWRRLEEVFRDHKPESVYHAAAYKHVPMMEAHLFEAVENNVFGTGNVARAATAFGAEDFVLVSSDKAVRPTNVMGATKRVAELTCLAAGHSSSTKFAAVRFGNVLGSNGSVIPLFKHQIAAGGPITVTHPEMQRFFMTIPEAARLVLQAAAMGRGGEIFVLDMGEPVRIVDLARKMILLSGLKPDEDIRIEFSGIRPGEKLYEEVSALEENTAPTPHAQIRVFSSREVSIERTWGSLEDLRMHSEARDRVGVVLALKEMVPDYNPSSFVLRQALQEKAKRALVVANVG